jgi:hypothetical protein
MTVIKMGGSDDVGMWKLDYKTLALDKNVGAPIYELIKLMGANGRSYIRKG